MMYRLLVLKLVAKMFVKPTSQLMMVLLVHDFHSNFNYKKDPILLSEIMIYDKN